MDNKRRGVILIMEILLFLVLLHYPLKGRYLHNLLGLSCLGISMLAMHRH